MIVRRFSEISIGFSIQENLREINFPPGMPLSSVNPADANIRVFLGSGNLQTEIPAGPIRLTRGRMTAYGDEGHIVWVHPEIGPFIDILPREGLVKAILPDWAWDKLDDVVNHILLPGLLPPFAARGLRAMHASAVEIDGMGILIAGASKSGKTTAALTVVNEGGRLIADDLTFYSRDGSDFLIQGLGEGPRAYDDVWIRFPQWNPGVKGSSGKRQLDYKSISWTKRAKLKKLIYLDRNVEFDNFSNAKILTSLLSLIYLVKFGPKAVNNLVRITENVEIQLASNSLEAARLAMALA